MDGNGKFTPATNLPPAAAVPRDEAERTLKNDLKVEQIGPGKLRIGLVTLDQASHSVRFPAKVNMEQGLVEYAVVTTTGKAHEAVFTTKASPRDIHLAMLLLGTKPSAGTATADHAISVPEAAAIRISVEWETNGPMKSYPLASLIALAKDAPETLTGRTLPNRDWLYNGSSFDANGFAAMREGSIISLIGDLMALANNAGGDRIDDGIHVPNKPLLPALGLPVTIVLTQAAPAKPQQPQTSPAPPITPTP